MDIVEKTDLVKTKKDFVTFLKDLGQDFIKNHDDWENWTIDQYLESISACVEAIRKGCSTYEEVDIDWDKLDYRALAFIFSVGKYYE